METQDLEFLVFGWVGRTTSRNTDSYDQIEMDDEALGDSAQWMPDGDLDPGRVLRRAADRHSAPELAGAGSDGHGAGDAERDQDGVDEAGQAGERRERRSVPESISIGEKVRVNPATGEYVDRAKKRQALAGVVRARHARACGAIDSSVGRNYRWVGSDEGHARPGFPW